MSEEIEALEAALDGVARGVADEYDGPRDADSVNAAGTALWAAKGNEIMLMLSDGDPVEPELVAVCGEYFVDMLVHFVTRE